MINSPNRKFNKAQKLLDKTEQYIEENRIQKAREKAESALEIYEELKTHLMAAKAHSKIGVSYEMEGKWEKAINKYEKAMDLCKEFGGPHLVAESHRNLARCKLYANQLKSAETHAQIAFDLLEDADNPDLVLQAEALFLLGSIYLKKDLYSSSIFYFKQVREMIRYEHNPHLFLSNQQNLANAYQEIGKYKESNNVLFGLLKTEQSFLNYPKILGILQSIAINLSMINQFKRALAYANDAKEIFRALQKSGGYVSAWNYYYKQAIVYYYCKKFELADSNCEKAIIASEENNMQLELMKSLLFMAKVLIAQYTGQEEEEKLILDYLKETRDYALEHEKWGIEIETYLQEAQLYKNTSKEHKIAEILELASEKAKTHDLDLYKGKIVIQKGFLAHEERDFNKAKEFFEKAIKRLEKAGHVDLLAEAHYNSACSACLLHLGEETIDHLRNAIKLNYKFKSIAQNDDDFKSIREEQAFLDVVKD